MNRRNLEGLVGVALIATAAACGEPPEVGDGTATRVEAPREAGLRHELLVDADWLVERIGSPEVVVLHIGEDEGGYQAAHVPGARFLPIGGLNEERDGVPNVLRDRDELARAFAEAGVSDDSHVVVYGAPLQAARAFLALEYVGHPRVSLLDGGYAAWAVAGAQPTRAPVPAVRGDLRASARTDNVVEGDWVRERLDDPSVLLIDARPPQQFTGEVPGDRVPRPGHIPGARNLFWEELIVSTDDPRLKDEATLRELFRGVGAAPDRTIVTYCRTGMQSSFAYFVSRYLGYETKTYDGSFVDWSAREDYPVERGI